MNTELRKLIFWFGGFSSGIALGVAIGLWLGQQG